MLAQSPALSDAIIRSSLFKYLLSDLTLGYRFPVYEHPPCVHDTFFHLKHLGLFPKRMLNGRFEVCSFPETLSRLDKKTPASYRLLLCHHLKTFVLTAIQHLKCSAPPFLLAECPCGCDIANPFLKIPIDNGAPPLSLSMFNGPSGLKTILSVVTEEISMSEGLADPLFLYSNFTLPITTVTDTVSPLLQRFLLCVSSLVFNAQSHLTRIIPASKNNLCSGFVFSLKKAYWCEMDFDGNLKFYIKSDGTWIKTKQILLKDITDVHENVNKQVQVSTSKLH